MKIGSCSADRRKRGLRYMIFIGRGAAKWHEKLRRIENQLLPPLNVRTGTAVPRARATLVERALRARFHLWIRRRDGSGLARLNFFTATGQPESARLEMETFEKLKRP